MFSFDFGVTHALPSGQGVTYGTASPSAPETPTMCERRAENVARGG
jgi:hypothetical protein